MTKKTAKMARDFPQSGRKLVKMVVPEIKIIDAKAGRAQTTVSSDTEDRDGDVISQKGWVLDYFQRHPILLSSHNYGSLINQIGEWEDMSVKSNQLVGVAKYYVGEGNKEADWGFNIASKGRAAYSVGFIPLEWEARDAKDSTRPAGEWGYKFLKQELLEVSHVTVPSNPDALQLMAKSGGISPEIRDLAREILAKIGEEGFYSEEGARKLLESMERKDMDCYGLGCSNEADVSVPLCPMCLQEMMSGMKSVNGEEMSRTELSELKEKGLPVEITSDTTVETPEETVEGELLSAESIDMKGMIKSAVMEALAEMGLSVIKGATSYSNLPLSDREKEWSGSDARKSVAKWASSDGSGDKDTIDWTKYAKAFFWFDSENKEAFGAYKLPFAEVVDGDLIAVWNGVNAAAGAVDGARNAPSIPSGDISTIKTHIAKYYAKAADEYDDDSIVPPWESDKEVDEDTVVQASVDETTVNNEEENEEVVTNDDPEVSVENEEEGEETEVKSMDDTLTEILKGIMYK